MTLCDVQERVYCLCSGFVEKCSAIIVLRISLPWVYTSVMIVIDSDETVDRISEEF